MKRILRRSAFAAIVLTLAFPATALAAKPAHPTKPAAVTFALRGTITSYSAATATSTGSVTISLTGSNHEQAALKGMSLTFATDANTKVVLHRDRAIANGDESVVELRAPKNATALALESLTASAVIDRGARNVMFVLRGTLTAYTAATSSTSGSVSITVKGSNHERSALKGTMLTFSTDSKTKVVLHDGNAIASGDNGIVKVRAPKNATSTMLESATAFQVIDQGAPSSTS